MKFLEAMEMIQYLMSLMESGNRVQVPKNRMDELESTLTQIIMLLGQEASPALQSAFEDLMSASAATRTMNITVLTEDLKDSVVRGLLKIKEEIATLAFQHFSINDFEPTQEIIPIMREVVAVHFGGVEID